MVNYQESEEETREPKEKLTDRDWARMKRIVRNIKNKGEE